MSGGVSFLSAACERVEQHGPATQGERYAVCGYCLCVKKGNCRTVFFVRKLLLFICCAPCVRRQYRSALFRPRSGAFLPAVFVAAVLPGFPGPAACFAGRSYYTRKKTTGTLLRSFILLFLTDFTMFFIKKALQMNFKNILYNYRSRFFTQIVSYRFVWGRQAMLSAPLLPCDRLLEPAGAAPLHQIKYRRKVMHHA